MSKVNSLFERAVGNAVLYDAVQRAAGLERLKRRLAPSLKRLEPGTLLDVGAGTGSFYTLLPPGVTYVPLDVDPGKLGRLRQKHGFEGVLASATALPFDDRSFDYALCTNVAHHLTDHELQTMVHELSRVTRRQLVFVDPLRTNRLASRLLWRIDRGSHPRSYDELVEQLTRRFIRRQAEALTLLHRYILFVGTPSPAT